MIAALVSPTPKVVIAGASGFIGRALFYINGGLLAQQTPGVPSVPSRLEFRVIPGDRFAIKSPGPAPSRLF